MKPLFVILAHSTMVAPSAFSQSAGNDLDSLGWLAGCREGTYANGRIVSEPWMKPMGDLMMGMSRTVKNGKTIESESVRLKRADDGSVHYLAQPSGQNEAIFRFVTRDSLSARVEGTIDGRERGADFPYRRVKCEQ